MSGQAVTFLTILAAIVVAASTGQWLLAIIGAVVVIGAHMAWFTYTDARNERAAKARRLARLSS